MSNDPNDPLLFSRVASASSAGLELGSTFWGHNVLKISTVAQGSNKAQFRLTHVVRDRNNFIKLLASQTRTFLRIKFKREWIVRGRVLVPHLLET